MMFRDICRFKQLHDVETRAITTQLGPASITPLPQTSRQDHHCPTIAPPWPLPYPPTASTRQQPMRTRSPPPSVAASPGPQQPATIPSPKLQPPTATTQQKRQPFASPAPTRHEPTPSRPPPLAVAALLRPLPTATAPRWPQSSASAAPICLRPTLLSIFRRCYPAEAITARYSRSAVAATVHRCHPAVTATVCLCRTDEASTNAAEAATTRGCCPVETAIRQKELHH